MLAWGLVVGTKWKDPEHARNAVWAAGWLVTVLLASQASWKAGPPCEISRCRPFKLRDSDGLIYPITRVSTASDSIMKKYTCLDLLARGEGWTPSRCRERWDSWEHIDQVFQNPQEKNPTVGACLSLETLSACLTVVPIDNLVWPHASNLLLCVVRSCRNGACVCKYLVLVTNSNVCVICEVGGQLSSLSVLFWCTLTKKLYFHVVKWIIYD